MKCPRCGLFNPDITQRCDCGYDFESQTVEKSYVAEGRRRKETSVTTRLRWPARVLGLIVVVVFSLMVLVASQAGTGGVWWTMVILVGVAVSGYLIACLGVSPRHTEPERAEGVGGATMIAAGLGGGIILAIRQEPLADLLFWSGPFIGVGVLFVLCWWLSNRT